MSQAEAKKIAKQYVRTMENNRFAYDQVYLFGSYAKGNPRKDSDIDIAVIVKNRGTGEKSLQKKMRLWRFTDSVDTRIEPLLLDKKQMSSGISPIADQVLKYGKRIA